jgi:hypothetical protein
MARHALTMPGRYDIYKGIDGTGNFVRRHWGNGHFVLIQPSITVIRDFGHL